MYVQYCSASAPCTHAEAFNPIVTPVALLAPKKDHVTCKGWHLTHLYDRINSQRGENVAMILIQMSTEMHYRTGQIHYSTLINKTRRTNKY